MKFRLFRFFRITVALITAEAVLLATSQQPASRAPSSTSSTSVHKPAAAQSPVTAEMMPMPIVAPLFIQNGTTDSEIAIVSDFSKTLNIDVILSGLSGDEFAKKKVTMDSHHTFVGSAYALYEKFAGPSLAAYKLGERLPKPAKLELRPSKLKHRAKVRRNT